MENVQQVDTKESQYFGRNRKRSFLNNVSTERSANPIEAENKIEVEVEQTPQIVKSPIFINENLVSKVEAKPVDSNLDDQITIQVVNKNEVKKLEITIPFSRIQSMENESVDGNVETEIKIPFLREKLMNEVPLHLAQTFNQKEVIKPENEPSIEIQLPQITQTEEPIQQNFEVRN